MSMRPGRISAASKASGKLVDMITMRPGESTTPSSTFRMPCGDNVDETGDVIYLICFNTCVCVIIISQKQRKYYKRRGGVWKGRTWFTPDIFDCMCHHHITKTTEILQTSRRGFEGENLVYTRLFSIILTARSSLSIMLERAFSFSSSSLFFDAA